MKKKNIIFSILSIGFIIASIMAFIYDYNCYGIILFILGLLMLAVALLINIFNVNVKKCIKINMSAFIAMSQKNKNKLNYKNMPTTFIVEEQTDSIDNQQEDSHSIEDNNFIIFNGMGIFLLIINKKIPIPLKIIILLQLKANQIQQM